jgi:hypothetical protein
LSYRKKLLFANTALAISTALSIPFTIMAVSIMSGTGFNSAQNFGSNAPAAQPRPNTDTQENDASKSSSGSSGNMYGPSSTPEYSTGGQTSEGTPVLGPAYLVDSNSYGTMHYSPLYQSSPYVVPITWGAIVGALIWRGKVRSQWCKQGYDYDTFRLLARMKGSPIRVALLTSVTHSAKTRSQLAEALSVDWKTIDNHIEVLAKNRLVQEMGSYGTSRYFAITEHGRRVLSLLLTLEDDNNISSGPPNDIGRATQTDSGSSLEKLRAN